jgi:DNA-binding NarL/FixJ family response regulator
VIRVLLVDDHAVVRHGLKQLLATDAEIEVVGMAADGEEAVDLVRRHRPDVVLMDLAMPGLDGIGATRSIVGEHPDVRVVVLTSFGDESRIIAALDAGAQGYLLKHTEPDALVEAVRSANAGLAPLDPRAGRALLNRQRERQIRAELSQREREVLELVTQGLANKQIARRLGISERTVKAHLTNIFQRIGVTDRTQAALWARANLDQDPPGRYR